VLVDCAGRPFGPGERGRNMCAARVDMTQGEDAGIGHNVRSGDVDAATQVIGEHELPAAQGLYDPALDKDSCGVGFIADLKGKKSHKIVEDALSILCNLEHRGAVGADPRAG